MVITFLSDFGLQDDFVGTCHGVMKRLAPQVEIIDITHGIPPQHVLQGALVLSNTLPYMPEGVHLAVVDPGVGGARRPLAIADREGRVFIGPDNGLLLPAAERAGIVEVRELVRSLGAEGRTIFISSHILSEVQQTADHVAIVAKGRLVTSGPVDEVLTTGGRGLLVKVADLDAGRRVLTEAQMPVVVAGGALKVDVPAEQAERVSRTLAEAGLFVTELRPDEVDLETVFLELTKDQGVGD